MVHVRKKSPSKSESARPHMCTSTGAHVTGSTCTFVHKFSTCTVKNVVVFTVLKKYTKIVLIVFKKVKKSVVKHIYCFSLKIEGVN